MPLHENPNISLRLAAWRNDLAEAKQALDAGADPNWARNNCCGSYEADTNALNNAARNRATEIVRLLIAHGANLNKVNSDGRNWSSPLDQCACHNNATEAKILLQASADPKAGSGLYTEQKAREHDNLAEFHDVDFGSDLEGIISAYDLAGCFIGGCYLPIMTTTYMICPDDHDHYTACGCRWP